MPQLQTVYACPHPIPAVRCRGCQKIMSVMVIESAANDHNKVTYHCEQCGAETQRTLGRASNH
jgi:predicted nucleic acid-binding Zn ribbon protein